eukprot:m.229786 g.229786  ORF g.229786 m.229786 type:complete len:1025 (+) comp15991_c0_seq27:243-3317(+)
MAFRGSTLLLLSIVLFWTLTIQDDSAIDFKDAACLGMSADLGLGLDKRIDLILYKANDLKVENLENGIQYGFVPNSKKSKIIRITNPLINTGLSCSLTGSDLSSLLLETVKESSTGDISSVCLLDTESSHMTVLAPQNVIPANNDMTSYESYMLNSSWSISCSRSNQYDEYSEYWALTYPKNNNSKNTDASLPDMSFFTNDIGDIPICGPSPESMPTVASNEHIKDFVVKLCHNDSNTSLGDVLQQLFLAADNAQRVNRKTTSLIFTCNPYVKWYPNMNISVTKTDTRVLIEHACACHNANMSCNSVYEAVTAEDKIVDRCITAYYNARKTYFVSSYSIGISLLISEAVRYNILRRKFLKVPVFPPWKEWTLDFVLSTLGLVSPAALNEGRSRAFVVAISFIIIFPSLVHDIFSGDNSYVIAAAYLVIMFPILAGFRATTLITGRCMGFAATVVVTVGNIHLLTVCEGDYYFIGILIISSFAILAGIYVSYAYIKDIVTLVIAMRKVTRSLNRKEAKHRKREIGMTATNQSSFFTPSVADRVALLWLNDDFRPYVKKLLSHETQKLDETKTPLYRRIYMGVSNLIHEISPRVTLAISLFLVILTGTLISISVTLKYFISKLEEFYTQGFCNQKSSMYMEGTPSFVWQKTVIQSSVRPFREIVPLDPTDCSKVYQLLWRWFYGIILFSLVLGTCFSLVQGYKGLVAYRSHRRAMALGTPLYAILGDKRIVANLNGPSAIIGALQVVGFQIIYLIGSAAVVAGTSACLLLFFVWAGSVLPAETEWPDWLWPRLFSFFVWDGRTPGLLVMSIVAYILLAVLAPYFFCASKERPQVKNRLGFDVFDLFETFFNMILGLFAFVARILSNAGFGLAFLSRLDKPALPRGYETFDSGFNAYINFLVVDHFYGNKVLVGNNLETAYDEKCISQDTFIKLLSEHSFYLHDWRDKNVNREEHPVAPDYTSPKTSRAFIRWQLAITLLNNPSLVALRRRGLTVVDVKQTQGEYVDILPDSVDKDNQNPLEEPLLP